MTFSSTDIKVIAQNYKTRLERTLDVFRQSGKEFNMETEKSRAFEQARNEFSNTRTLNDETAFELRKAVKEYLKKEKEDKQHKIIDELKSSQQQKEIGELYEAELLTEERSEEQKETERILREDHSHIIKHGRSFLR